MSSESNSPASGYLTSALADCLGVRRTATLRRIMKQTGLPPETLLDLALQLLDLASEKLAPSPIERQAIGLGAARWRDVGPEERSETLRRVAEARWGKQRRKAFGTSNQNRKSRR